MRRKWIPVAVAVALFVGGAQAGAQSKESAKAPSAPTTASTPDKGWSPKKMPPEKKKLVSLNQASKAELKALPGGSDAEAERIIAGRPYNTKASLVTDKIITDGRYSQIKALIVAGDLPKGAPKK